MLELGLQLMMYKLRWLNISNPEFEMTKKRMLDIVPIWRERGITKQLKMEL